jgi:hypothetical protein
MQTYSLSQLSDHAVLQGFDTLDARDLATSAALLAYVAEVDSRKLYLPAGYPSMFAFCVRGRRWSDDVAAKRIQAGRVAQRFPVIFPALAESRLHLSAVVLLAPHLTEDTAAELLTAATHKTKAEIEQLLAARFPRTDVLSWMAGPAPAPSRSEDEHAP